MRASARARGNSSKQHKSTTDHVYDGHNAAAKLLSWLWAAVLGEHQWARPEIGTLHGSTRRREWLISYGVGKKPHFRGIVRSMLPNVQAYRSAPCVVERRETQAGPLLPLLCTNLLTGARNNFNHVSHVQSSSRQAACMREPMPDGRTANWNIVESVTNREAIAWTS
jgi:hypothetical protein